MKAVRSSVTYLVREAVGRTTFGGSGQGRRGFISLRAEQVDLLGNECRKAVTACEATVAEKCLAAEWP